MSVVTTEYVVAHKNSTPMSLELVKKLGELVARLFELECEDYRKKGYTIDPRPAIWREHPKFVAIDYGDGGAFLVEKATGKLFNIKGYGRPDYNKKQKADIGNIFTVDPVVLHSKRYNYLR